MSWPYNSPESFDGGYWTSSSGSLDWCEENYTHSPYIAETANTLSNLAYICLGIYGLYSAIHQSTPLHFKLGYISLLCVGVGSALYHGTLRRWAQGFDEVLMMSTVGFVAYTVFEVSPLRNKKSRNIPIATVAGGVLWVALYSKIETPLFHEISFALLLIVTTARVVLLLFVNSAHSSSAHALSQSPQRSTIQHTAARGTFWFTLGFAVWNLDNIYCTELRKFRTSMASATFGGNGEARGIMNRFIGVWVGWHWINGHAFWHLATAYGSYLQMVSCQLMVLVIRSGGSEPWSLNGTILPVLSKTTSKEPSAAKGASKAQQIYKGVQDSRS